MNLLTLSILFYLDLFKYAITFNLSPRPVRKLTEPNLRFYPSKFESSYFGYQINLRETSVIVSAPRGQTTIWAQRKFNETGSLYKCDLSDNSVCELWKIDESDGNRPVDGYTYLKSNQWFGAAMDGDSSDNDLLTVCAPNIVSVKTDYQDRETDYFTHGKCYLIENFGIQRIREFHPLSNTYHQTKQLLQLGKIVPFPHFFYGQMGFSVQMFKSLNEYIVVMGAPGILTGCGGVVQWKSHTTRKSANLINAFDQFDVTDPTYFDSNSYFGYAVAIGNFLSKNRVSYAASAPRAGFVYLFSFYDNTRIVENYSHRMRIAKKILGEQFGEYFGYALLADDFNNDQYTDLAIGAPMFTKKGTSENGKVYLYNCKQLVCEYGDAIFSNYDGSGRFGMAFAKLGDINRDGYNDLAVGAPYEGNGKVYIFLGGRNGLSTTPSQVISAPEHVQTFGLGLSKGVDIDKNSYNDLVIGAPDSDAVFIYKSYPVVKIFTTFEPDTDKVSINDRSLAFTICASYFTPLLSFKSNVSIILTISLDPQLNRVTFFHSKKRSETIELAITKSHNQNCRTHQTHLNHSAVVQLPIVLEAQYELKKYHHKGAQFCTDCVSVNPADPKVVQTKIAIKSGCVNDKWCMSDLTVRSNLTSKRLTQILGKPNLITIEYEIRNLGETAYFPKISITLSPSTPFAKISPNCYVNETILHCYLMNSIPLFSNTQAKSLVTIDPVDLYGEHLTITAVVSTSSNETNPDDNVLVNKIDLVEYNEVEIIGNAKPAQISIEVDDLTSQLYITHEFLIINYGYSTMQKIFFTAHIPQIYNGTYNLVDQIAIDIDREGLEFESATISNRYRVKRETLEHVMEEALENRIVHIPHHRARYFNCSSVTYGIHDCTARTLELNNFVAKEKIKVIVNMTVNLEHLQKIVNKTQNMLLLEIIPTLVKVNDSMLKTYKLTAMNTLTAIELITEGKTPLIWIIVSIIVGILVLCAIIYWFHRMGFFRRNLKTKVEKMRRETLQIYCKIAERESVQFTEEEEQEQETLQK